MDYKAAQKLQPGDRIMSVGDKHFLMQWGGFLTTGTIVHITEDCRGIFIERDAGGRMWVSAAHVHDYALEGDRTDWRSAISKEISEAYRGPFERKSSAPVQDADPQRLLSAHSLREVRDIIVKTTAATGGKDAVKKIFRGVGLDDIDHIQPWHHDVIYKACVATYLAAAKATDDIEALM
jgi:hypothetical protein